MYGGGLQEVPDDLHGGLQRTEPTLIIPSINKATYLQYLSTLFLAPSVIQSANQYFSQCLSNRLTGQAF